MVWCQSALELQGPRQNETNRQNNTLFLTKGLAPVREAVPFDEVKLVDVGLEAWNDADYVIVASSPLGKALVITLAQRWRAVHALG